MADTTIAAATLAAYRTDHRIVAVDGRCETDGIRVHPIKGGRMRHDPGDIVKLMDANYGKPWPSHQAQEDAAAVEVARDMIREDFTLERVSVPWGRHVVDIDVAPDPEDDEWTNREGMPEFNGALR